MHIYLYYIYLWYVSVFVARALHISHWQLKMINCAAPHLLIVLKTKVWVLHFTLHTYTHTYIHVNNHMHNHTSLSPLSVHLCRFAQRVGIEIFQKFRQIRKRFVALPAARCSHLQSGGLWNPFSFPLPFFWE